MTATLKAIEASHRIAPVDMARGLLEAACQFYREHGWFTFPVVIQPEAFQARYVAEERAVYEMDRKGLVGHVETDQDRRVTACDADFTAICGYTLEELRGKNLGPLLRGEATQPKAAKKMDDAIHARRAVEVVITNYDKQRRPYEAKIQVQPTKTGFSAVVRLANHDRR